MNRYVLVFLMVALPLGGCGDGPCGPDEAGAPGGTAAGESSLELTPRAEPLAVGASAPAFEKLPAGPVVLVFYRGHW